RSKRYRCFRLRTRCTASQLAPGRVRPFRHQLVPGQARFRSPDSGPPTNVRHWFSPELNLNSLRGELAWRIAYRVPEIRLLARLRKRQQVLRRVQEMLEDSIAILLLVRDVAGGARRIRLEVQHRIRHHAADFGDRL